MTTSYAGMQPHARPPPVTFTTTSTLDDMRLAFGHNERPVYTLFASTELDLELLKHKNNRSAAAALGSPIVHCETYFPFGFDDRMLDPHYTPGQPVSFSVTSGKPADWTFHRDHLNHATWLIIQNILPLDRYMALRRVLNDHVGEHFDACGFWGAYYCKTTAFMSSHLTMCSRLCAEAYSHPAVGILPPLRVPAEEVTPPMLYEMLKPTAQRNQLAALPSVTEAARKRLY